MTRIEDDPFGQFDEAGADTGTHPVAEVLVPRLHKAIAPLGDTLPLAKALDAARELAPALTLADREAIVDQTRKAIDGFYAHLFLKRARHAYDPVAALDRLRRVCGDYETDLEFHLALSGILRRMQDIHTGYVLPPPYSRMVAFLPFTVARCNIDPGALSPGSDTPRVAIVSGVMEGFDHESFRPGVRIVSWNGIPIETAIRRVGAGQQGANRAAQLSFGALMLTIRWLGGSEPPIEMWVTVGYDDDEGKLREIRFPWRVMLLDESGSPAGHAFPPLQALAQLHGHLHDLDRSQPISVVRAPLTNRSMARLLYHAPTRRAKDKDAAAGETGPVLRRKPIRTGQAETFSAEILRCTLENGRTVEFGRIHLHHFIYPGTADYLAAFRTILAQLPKTGLVVDIRGNGGGVITTAEQVVQLVSRKTIQPLAFQFRATEQVAQVVASRAFGQAKSELPGWDRKVAPLIDDAAQYSLNGYMTEAATLAAIPETDRYPGPVILMTDAMTYSAGDMFAASFQDHGIGPVIGVDRRTGGGGANLWFHGLTARYGGPESGLSDLPGGVQLHYAVRRALRIGPENGGLPFEEDGVEPDILRPLTRSDLTDHARDLLIYAAKVFDDPEAARAAN